MKYPAVELVQPALSAPPENAHSHMEHMHIKACESSKSMSSQYCSKKLNLIWTILETKGSSLSRIWDQF